MTFVRNASAAFSRRDVRRLHYYYYYHRRRRRRRSDQSCRSVSAPTFVIIIIIFRPLLFLYVLLSASRWISTKPRTIISRTVHNIVIAGESDPRGVGIYYYVPLYPVRRIIPRLRRVVVIECRANIRHI